MQYYSENVRPIKKTFLDKIDNVYVVDNNDVLYMYDNGEFYPFANVKENIMEDIKDCFFINSTFFVYHSNTISIFDVGLFKVDMVENTWITHNIDQVCYHMEYNLIATLERGELYVHTNIDDTVGSDHEIDRISLSHYRFKDDNGDIHIEYKQFEHIKIIDNILLALDNSRELSVFLLNSHGKIRRISLLNINKQLYDRIINYNEDYQILILDNGNYMSLNGTFHIPNKHIDKTFNNLIFNHNGCLFMVQNNSLIGYYEKREYESLIKPMIDIFSDATYELADVPNSSHGIMTIVLPPNINFKIINGNFSQLIIHDNRYYIITLSTKLPIIQGAPIPGTTCEFHEIILTNDVIYFDKINEYYPEKMDTRLMIDMDIKKPVVEQLINIIPAVYRLNNEMIYGFEQINSQNNDEIVSYGEGVTRHIFNNLRKELDCIMENKFSGYDPLSCYKLGKLLYFCNRDGQQTFECIHPYFFFSLSKESDHVTLIKKFRGSDYQLYYDQYVQYSHNLAKLEELYLGLRTIGDFMRYLLSSDLAPKEIILYDEFIKGYNFFGDRNKLSKLIKKFPIKYHIEKLIATYFFDAELEYSVKTHSVSREHFKTFCITFRKLFGDLTKKEKCMFLQNVTGSCYYNGIIKVILAYEEKEIITKQLVYNANIIDEEEPESINNVIIGLDENEPTNVTYSVSTCSTELIINTKPTEENITTILNLLTIEDHNMKN